MPWTSRTYQLIVWRVGAAWFLFVACVSSAGGIRAPFATAMSSVPACGDHCALCNHVAGEEATNMQVP